MTRRTPEGAEKRQRIIEMRRNRMTQDEIARTLGISQPRVSQLYAEAIRELPSPTLEQHRKEEMELADAATQDLLLLARDSRLSARTRIEAWRTLCSWAERKSRLLGLDEPVRTRQEVITGSVVDAEIERLITEILAAGGTPPDPPDPSQPPIEILREAQARTQRDWQP